MLGCGLVFLRRGLGCSAFAVVLPALVVGSRSVLVVPRGFVCLSVGSRFVLVLAFRVWRVFAFGAGRSAHAVVSLLRVVGWY